MYFQAVELLELELMILPESVQKLAQVQVLWFLEQAPLEEDFQAQHQQQLLPFLQMHFRLTLQFETVELLVYFLVLE